MTRTDRQDLILLDALDPRALEPAERDALRAHLAAGCPTCAAALAEARAVVAQVMAATPPLAPPAAALDALMDRIAPGPMRITAPRPRSRAFVASLIAAAAAAAVTAGTFLYATRDSRLLFESHDVAALALTSATQPGASGRVLWDREHGRWNLSVANLAPTAAGRVYELWLIPSGGKPIRSQTFTVDAARTARVVVSVPADLGPLAIAAITDEPQGGTDAPTGQIHLSGAFR